MTRYIMVIDLRRCVGCQTCTAACKHKSATPPGVQWRAVLDVESGQFPEVRRTFVPVGCQHCAKPPCMYVCPTTATRQRDDGIVTIDYNLCIGCGYCIVSCPYQARFKESSLHYAYDGQPLPSEAVRAEEGRVGVATKCTYCVDRIDANSCISDAIHFGDVEDPDSHVSQLLRENEHFRMHEELGTEPNFYYVWETTLDGASAAAGTGG